MRVILLIILAIIFFSGPSFSFAHTSGVSTVKINNRPADVYTAEEYALIGDETVPSDIASGKFLVNQVITFEVDKGAPGTDIEVDSATYTWDFGDGRKTRGKSVKHIFTKAKSYIVNLEIDYGSQRSFDDAMGNDPQSQKAYQSILIHILPKKDYKIPALKFVIDGKKINNPLKERPEFDFENRFLFFKFPKAVSYSTADYTGTSKIISYLWDFGDGVLSTKANPRHRFKEKHYFHTVGLKVTDEKGFFTYLIANLADKKAFEENSEEN